MPELPNLTVYVEALGDRVVGSRLERVRLGSPSLVRTVDPPIDAAQGRTVVGVGLLGKRIVCSLSDEILHAARLSPMQLTRNLDAEESGRLHAAVLTTLRAWTDRLRAEAGGAFPEKVTAFREGMAVHGRFRQPCPDCGAPVQRIVYAENEADYCARGQTNGRLLADRALSRLLRDDWPKRLEDVAE